MTAASDAIIVGAGVVGCAIAHELTRSGMSVHVLERSFVGSGATSAGMGHIVVMDDSPAQLELTAYSRTLLNELAPDLGSAVERDTCGTLWVAEDDEQMAEVLRKQERHQAAGVAGEVLDAHGIAAAEPNLRRGLAGGLRVPGDEVVYPPALARWLMDRACDSGARLTCGVNVQAIHDALVESDRGSFTAQHVINATGAHAPALTRGIDVVPRKGHLVITDRYPDYCRHQLVEMGYLTSAHTMNSESVAFNVQPRSTGQLLIGSSRELAGWDAAINRSIVDRMLRRAVQFMPGLANLSAIRTWCGFRPATPHKLPYILRAPGCDNVWVAAGHEGLGITTALGTARLLAQMIAGEPTWTDPAPYAL